MDHLTLVLGDFTLLAIKIKGTNEWEVIITNHKSGHIAKATIWCNRQIRAVLALAFCNEEADMINEDVCYAIADPLFEGWQEDLKIIP